MISSEIKSIIDKEQFILNELNKYTIQVGVIEGESKERKLVSFGLTNAELMFIHENGSAVRNIPERPVLQFTIDYAKETLLNEFLDTVFTKIMKESVKYTQLTSILETELEKLCIRLQNYAQDIIYKEDSRLARNAESTIKRKGFDKPLFQTGQLARSLVCRFVKN